MDKIAEQTNEARMTTTQMQLAANLGVSLVKFTATEWIGRNGEGSHRNVNRYYWADSQMYFHSGPFTNESQAFQFIEVGYAPIAQPERTLA